MCRERWDLNVDFYWKPYSHIGPFCVGLALGHILAVNRMIRFSKTTRVTGWCLSLLMLFLALFGSHGWTIGKQSHAVINALHSATHRTVWSAGLAWITYACATGNGGWINTFLSWKGFVPMSRLTFMVALVHPWLVWIYMGTRKTMLDFNYNSIVRMTSEFTDHS